MPHCEDQRKSIAVESCLPDQSGGEETEPLAAGGERSDGPRGLAARPTSRRERQRLINRPSRTMNLGSFSAVWLLLAGILAFGSGGVTALSSGFDDAVAPNEAAASRLGRRQVVTNLPTAPVLTGTSTSTTSSTTSSRSTKKTRTTRKKTTTKRRRTTRTKTTKTTTSVTSSTESWTTLTVTATTTEATTTQDTTTETQTTATPAPEDPITVQCNERFGEGIELAMSCDDVCSAFYLNAEIASLCVGPCQQQYPDGTVTGDCTAFISQVIYSLPDTPDGLNATATEEPAGAPTEEPTAVETPTEAPTEAPTAAEGDATVLPEGTLTESLTESLTETLTESLSMTLEASNSVPTFSLSLPTEPASLTPETTTTRKAAFSTKSTNRLTQVQATASTTRPNPLSGRPGGLIDQIAGAHRVTGEKTTMGCLFGSIGLAVWMILG